PPAAARDAETPLVAQWSWPGRRDPESRRGSLSDRQTHGFLGDDRRARGRATVPGIGSMIDQSTDERATPAERRVAGDDQSVGEKMGAAKQVQGRGSDAVADDEGQTVRHDATGRAQRAAVEQEAAARLR